MQIDDLRAELAGALLGLADVLRTARQHPAGCADCDRLICDRLVELADEYVMNEATLECGGQIQRGRRLQQITVGEVIS
jgi:hypothetical protein